MVERNQPQDSSEWLSSGKFNQIAVQVLYQSMKTTLALLYVILVTALATIGGLAQQTNISTTEQLPRLYLHVFNGGQIFGTNESAATYIPPMIVLSTNIQPGEVIENRSGGGGPPLLVGIEARDGRYFLHTWDGSPVFPEYHSEIELEKPFSPASHPMREAINHLECFVLSTNSSYEPFLESLRAEVSKALAPRKPDPRFDPAFKTNALSR